MEGVFQPAFFYAGSFLIRVCWRVRILRARTKKTRFLMLFLGDFSNPNIIEFFLSSLSCRPTAILFASQWTYLENMPYKRNIHSRYSIFFTPFHVTGSCGKSREKMIINSKLGLERHDFQRQKINPKAREKKHNPPTCFLEIEDFLRMCRFAPVFHTLFLYLPPLSDAFSRKMNKPMLDVSPVWHLPEISNLKPLHWSSWCSAKHLRCCMLP